MTFGQDLASNQPDLTQIRQSGFQRVGMLGEDVGLFENEQVMRQIRSMLVQPVADRPDGGLWIGIVMKDYLMDPLDRQFVKTHAQEDIPGDGCASALMAVKPRDALFVKTEHDGFADVVQQGRQAEGATGWNLCEHVQRVLKQIEMMMCGQQFVAAHGQDFRDEDTDHIQLITDCSRGTNAADQFAEFHLDPLDGNQTQTIPSLVDCCRCVRLNREAKHRRKTERAQNAQWIFAKPVDWRTDTADPFVSQISLTAKRIDHILSQKSDRNVFRRYLGYLKKVICRFPQVWRPGHGIDCKIPACQIFLQSAGELDMVWPASVRVGAIDPVRRDLKREAIEDNQDCAMF